MPSIRMWPKNKLILGHRFKIYSDNYGAEYFDLCNANNPIKGLDLNYGFQSADS